MNRISILMLTLLCGGCTSFENPLVAESGPAVDERLVGHWVLENEKGRFELDVRAEERSGIVIVRTQETEEEPETTWLRLITAQVGRHAFGSVRTLNKPGGPWSLFHYELLRDQLVIRFADDGFWKDQIERKLVAGSIEEQRLSVTVTASEAELRALLLKYGARIFVEDGDLHSVFLRVPEVVTPTRP